MAIRPSHYRGHELPDISLSYLRTLNFRLFSFIFLYLLCFTLLAPMTHERINALLSLAT